MEFCSPNRASGPTHTHAPNYTRGLSPTHRRTHSSLPRPGAPNTIPGPEDPVIKGCGHCRTGGGVQDKDTAPCQGSGGLRLLLSQETGRSGLPRAQGQAAELKGEASRQPDDPPRLYYPIPAILKHSHQTGYRCQEFPHSPLHPAGFQGSPQLP